MPSESVCFVFQTISNLNRKDINVMESLIIIEYTLDYLIDRGLFVNFLILFLPPSPSRT